MDQPVERPADTVRTLCVSMLTFNQRPFVAAAIEGVLSQRTRFPVTLHIGDDCSTDGTQDVLRQYRDAHPGRIILHLADKRGDGRYGRLNNISNINACRDADYIALLDGDDVWIDQEKLQEQFDFLESNADYSAIGHDAHYLHEETGLRSGRIGDAMGPLVGRERERAPVLDLDQEVLFRFIPQSSTLCFRSSALPSFPEWFWTVPGGDKALVMLLAGSGPVRFDRTPRSLYRVHGESEWQRLVAGARTEMDSWDLGNFEQLLRAFPAARSRRNLAQFALLKTRHSLGTGSVVAAARHLWSAVNLHPPTLAATAGRKFLRLLR